LIVQLDEEAHRYTYQEITAQSTFANHNPAGDTLYGADIFVHPEFQGRGVSSKLYDYRVKILKRYNLRRMVAFGRLPGYSAHAGKYFADQYVNEVLAGRMKDQALSAHLKAGYKVKKVLLNYIEDEGGLDHCTLLEYLNPYFKPEKRRVAIAPIRGISKRMRVFAVQYKTRMIKGWDDFARTTEYFVNVANDYHSHFIVFPEYFTFQIFCTYPDDTSWVDSLKNLAGLVDKFCAHFKRLSTECQLYIIAGTLPTLRDERIYNTSYLFAPSGEVYTQDKLHMTPEEQSWGLTPGEDVKIFSTPFGRISIQICYDIEFPELSRLLALAGVEVIFVSFSTNDRKAYHRVRRTAHARAIENYLYVVISGNVGNLPTAKDLLTHYGQAAIFTPSDHAFPMDATLADADPNVETFVVVDLDLNLLEHQREIGSVRPFFDRRRDLYTIQPTIPFRVIRL
jgi:predicted amidohydrolase/GNAT superfamily N-acetyltransferase